MLSIINKNGGSIDVGVSNSMIYGYRVMIHIDESVNVNNGEGEASTLLTITECKDLLFALNEIIKIAEGRDYVYTSESVIKLISTPEIQEVLVKLGYDKKTDDKIIDDIKNQKS